MSIYDIVGTQKSKEDLLPLMLEAYKKIPKENIFAYTDYSFAFMSSYKKLEVAYFGGCYISIIDDGRGKFSVCGAPIPEDGDMFKTTECIEFLVEAGVTILNCSEDTLNEIKRNKRCFTSLAKSEIFKWVQYYAKSEDFITLEGPQMKQFRRVWNTEKYQNLKYVCYTNAKDIPKEAQADIIEMMKLWEGNKKDKLKKLYYLHNVANALPYNVGRLPEYIDFALIMLYNGDKLLCYSITEMSHESHMYTVEGKRDLNDVDFPDINKYIHLLEIKHWQLKFGTEFTIELGRGNQILNNKITIKNVKALPLLDSNNLIFTESLNKAKLLLRPFYANLSVRFNAYKFNKKPKAAKKVEGRLKLW